MLPITLSEQEGAAVCYFISGAAEFFDICDSVQSKLMDAFADEMPYGTAKARTGDPDQWLYARFQEMSDDEKAVWLIDCLETEELRNKYRKVIGEPTVD